DGPVTDYASAKRSDTKRYARYFHAMLERGVFLAPSQFEAAFVSLAHTDADIALAGRAADEALAAGRASGRRGARRRLSATPPRRRHAHRGCLHRSNRANRLTGTGTT